MEEATEADIRIERACQVFSTDKEKRACERGFREGVSYSIEALRFVKRRWKNV